MTLYEDVRDFHRKFAHPAPAHPTPLDSELLEVRLKLLREEYMELRAAMEGQMAMGRIVQECADLIYVTIGTMVSMGVPLNQVWAEVHRANMSKYPNPGGPLCKPIKPPDWNGPRCSDIVLRLLDDVGGKI